MWPSPVAGTIGTRFSTRPRSLRSWFFSDSALSYVCGQQQQSTEIKSWWIRIQFYQASKYWRYSSHSTWSGVLLSFSEPLGWFWGEALVPSKQSFHSVTDEEQRGKTRPNLTSELWADCSSKNIDTLWPRSLCSEPSDTFSSGLHHYIKIILIGNHWFVEV